MAYITIANSEIDANSPLNFSLGRKFRDNPEAIAGGTASIKYLIPPARCSTPAGMFRADLRPGQAPRVVSSPYTTGQPPFVFTAAATSWAVPAGWTKIHIELWGAGQDGTGPFSIGEPGGWSESIVAVTPGQTLSIAIGQTSGQDSTIVNVGGLAVSMLAPGGGSGSVAVGQTTDRTGARSGGFQDTTGLVAGDGAKNYGGQGKGTARPGFCLMRGLP